MRQDARALTERLIINEPQLRGGPAPETDCPAATIGRQLAAARAAADEAEEDHLNRQAGDRGPSYLGSQLEDLSLHLLDKLGWVTPSSLDGLTVLGVALHDAVDDVCAAHQVDDETPDGRRLRRLFGRLFAALADLSGHTPADLGLGYWWSGVAGETPTLSTAGEVVVPAAA